MNVLSLFDGISCGQIALQRAGIKVDKYYASEIDKFAIKVTMANHPDTIQVGDVSNLKGLDFPDIDMIIGGSPCFDGNELVMTSIGYKKIKEVSVGDYVLTHKGRYRKVLRIGHSFKQIWIIKGMGNPGIQTTREHPFLIRNRYRIWDNQNKVHVRKFHAPEWKKIKNITKNDYCCMISNEEKTTPLNEKMWYLLGRYTGDGWYRETRRKNRINSHVYQFIICCGHHEFEDLDKIFSEFGRNYNYSKERTGYKFRISSQKLVQLVKPIGRGASNKKVHPDLFMESNENIKAYINGILDSDGCYHEQQKEYRITSTSKELCLGIQFLVNKVYKVKTYLYFTERPKKTIIEGRLVNQKDTYTISWKPNVRKQDKGFHEDGQTWLPTNKIYKTDYKNIVYNIEVEEDNSYTINNLAVHNCQGFSTSGKGLNFEDPRSRLFFEFVRLLNEIKPKYFLLENVVMKKEWQDIITNLVGVQPMMINSSLVSAQSRKRLYWTNIPEVTQPADKGINLIDIIDIEDDKTNPSAIRGRHLNKATILGRRLNEEGKREDYNHAIPITQCLEVRNVDRHKSNCLTTVEKDNVLTSMPIGRHPDAFKNKLPFRYYNVKEYCRLQTVPENYFENIVSNSQAKKMLGNGWTVDVIAHIFSCIKKEETIEQVS